MIAALLLAVVPYAEPPTIRGAVLELNHYHDEQGRKVLMQWIVWEWQEDRLVVAWWKLAKPGDVRYKTRLRFGGAAGLTEVRCDTFLETWTQYDREIENRAVWPVSRRRHPAER